MLIPWYAEILACDFVAGFVEDVFLSELMLMPSCSEIL